MRYLVLARGHVGLRRKPGLPHLRTVAQRELDLTMAFPRLPSGDPVAPFGVHVFEVKIVRLEDVHVAIEDLEAVSCHGRDSFCVAPAPPRPGTVSASVR